jgi:hypothetical protein
LLIYMDYVIILIIMAKKGIPTLAEQAMAADVYSRMPRGEDLPLNMWQGANPFFSKVTANLVVFRPVEERVDMSSDVLLLQRPDDDPDWPGEWHIPGRVYRGRFGNWRGALDEVIEKELGGIVLATTPIFRFEEEPIDGPRGVEMLKMFSAMVEPGTEPPQGEFHPLDSLPRPMVTKHDYLALRTAASLRGGQL